MVVKRCSDCGSELREEARFCDQCGFPVGQEEADLIFGRSEECSVRFSDPTVSRRHARAVCVGGVWYLRDEGSKNGTFVNGKRLYPRAWRKLQLGDQIRLGAKVILRLTEKGWMDGEGKVLWQTPQRSTPTAAESSFAQQRTQQESHQSRPHLTSTKPCPFCQVRIPEPFVLAFCPNCGYPLRWLVRPSVRNPILVKSSSLPLTLTFEVQGVGKEPLELVFRSEQPEQLLLGVGETPKEVERCFCRVGEKVDLRLWIQPLKDETEVAISVRSLFYPVGASKKEKPRPEWHPKELEREERLVLRLIPYIPRLRWVPSLVLLSYRHPKQSVRLVNESPFPVTGKLRVSEPLRVYPSEVKWSLASKKAKEWQLEAGKEWAKEQPCELVAEPDEGEAVRCIVFWVGGEREVRQPDVVVGVDFGTSKSALAVLDFRQNSPNPQLLTLQGQQVVPSLLLFLEGRQEPLMGQDAEARLGDPTALPVQGVKLLLRSNRTVQWAGRFWTSLQLTQRFLAFLKRQVDLVYGDDQQCLKRFELGLPVLDRESDYEKQRDLSIQAAGEAGMKWVRVWLEPVCAAAYVLHKWREFAQGLPLPRPGDWFLVLDWGAGTLDATLLVYEKPEPPFFELPPLVGVGLEQGGQHLDWYLTCEFAESVGLQELLNEARQLGWKEFRWRGSLPLRQLAETVREAKEQLDRQNSFSVADFRSRLTAPEFTDLDPRFVLVSRPSVNWWVQETLAELKKRLDEHLSPSDWQQIAYVLVVGGTGQIPLVRELLGDWIGKPERVVQLRGEDAILAVAYGAALIGEVRLTGMPFPVSLSVNGKREELLRVGDHLTRIERTFNVPLAGLTAELLARVRDTDYLLASVRLEYQQAERVRMQLDTDEEGWLWWRWWAGEKLLDEQKILALP